MDRTREERKQALAAGGRQGRAKREEPLDDIVDVGENRKSRRIEEELAAGEERREFRRSLPRHAPAGRTLPHAVAPKTARYGGTDSRARRSSDARRRLENWIWNSVSALILSRQ